VERIEDGPVTTARESATASSSKLPKLHRFVLGRTLVDRVSMEYAVRLLVEALRHRGSLPPLTVVGPNAQLVTLAERDEPFAHAMQVADLAIPDGISVVMASRLLGFPLPERVTGGDLMESLCAEAARYGFRVFLLGGPPGVAMTAADKLRQQFPGLQVCGTYCPPLGFEFDPAELARMRAAINEASPDLLCVAFGAPKQEVWMQQNRSLLSAGVMLAVGAAFERHAGLRRRAPRWVQRIALEWLFRLILEPRRLWRRYLIGNTCFVLLILRQALAEKWAAVRRQFAKA
jgi:N-acetylglucosaminyldiphosphoundecaprenol N-acetyl-beta-D-mannosaminyltransferase